MQTLIRAVALAFVVTLGACSPDGGDGPSESASAAAASVGTEVGACIEGELALSSRNGPNGIPSVPCTESHEFEVFALVTLDDGEYPGTQALLDTSEERCTDEVEGYAGVGPHVIPVVVRTLAPSEDEWAEGERVAVCLAEFVPAIDVSIRDVDLSNGLAGNGRVTMHALQEGQCLDTTTDLNAELHRLVDCSEPHLYEVLAVTQIGAGGASEPAATESAASEQEPQEPWPGEEAVIGEAFDLCGAEFEAATGAPPGPDDPEMIAVWPLERTWTEFGDRRVLCLLVADPAT